MTKQFLILIISNAAMLLLGLFLFRQSPAPDNYREEFEKLILEQKKEIIQEIHSAEDSIKIHQDNVTGLKLSSEKMATEHKKYPAKYEKINHDVRNIADDSLASEFSKEFGQH